MLSLSGCYVYAYLCVSQWEQKEYMKYSVNSHSKVDVALTQYSSRENSNVKVFSHVSHRCVIQCKTETEPWRIVCRDMTVLGLFPDCCFCQAILVIFVFSTQLVLSYIIMLCIIYTQSYNYNTLGKAEGKKVLSLYHRNHTTRQEKQCIVFQHQTVTLPHRTHTTRQAVYSISAPNGNIAPS